MNGQIKSSSEYVYLSVVCIFAIATVTITKKTTMKKKKRRTHSVKISK